MKKAKQKEEQILRYSYTVANCVLGDLFVEEYSTEMVKKNSVLHFKLDQAVF